MIKIGSHVSMSGDTMYLGSVEEALGYKANALMIYTGAPQNTIRKKTDQLKVDEALSYMNQIGFDVKNVVVHAPYIINLANPSEEKRAFAISFLTEEVQLVKIENKPSNGLLKVLIKLLKTRKI